MKLRDSTSCRFEVEDLARKLTSAVKFDDTAYVALGETLDGRLAFVVFRRLSGGRVRVITARDMDASERRLFRRK